MAWLLLDQRVLASLEVADTRKARRRGLLGRDGIDGALLITRTRSVHTFGMRFDLDVAFLDGDDTVLRTRRLRRGRLTLPVRGARSVLEAEAGAFERWGLEVGQQLEITDGDGPVP